MKTQINKSDLFKNAWARFKANKTRITFARSLKMAWEFAKEQAGYVVEEVKPVVEAVKVTKEQLIQEAKMYILKTFGQFCYFQQEIDQEVKALVSLVRIDDKGFAREVATSVLKYKKASEKQAYVIARAAVELGQYTEKNRF